jgi:molecular chaperone GrpE
VTTPTPEEEPKVVIRDRRRIDPETGQARHVDDAAHSEDGTAAGATPAAEAEGIPDPDLEKLRTELEERTADLQRVSAEYANYRRRVDRDRAVASEHATAAVLTALLPVLDDVDRARAHGDLTGAFAAVAEQLSSSLQRLGLTTFGAPGDAFDPVWHEAVLHTESAEVGQPTCVDVMRRGYALGDRMLRPAMVAVADPAAPVPAEPGPGAAPTENE